jgi:predicted peptidase
MQVVSGLKKTRLCMAMCVIWGAGLAGCGGNSTTAATDTTAATTTTATPATTTTTTAATVTSTADKAITGISTTGVVDVDGAKAQAVAIKYNIELKGASIDASTFELWDYALGQAVERGANPGALKAVYIDDEAYDTDGKTGSGSYVVITLNTDYQLAAVPKYQAAMAAGIKQIRAFTTAGGTQVTASVTEFTNYTVVTAVNMQGVSTYTNTAKTDSFNISNIKNFKRYTNDTATVLGYTPDGAAFHATNCFDEIDGLLHDVDLPYALHVPADYDPSKKYMLVLHVVDAGALGTDPMITLTESKADVNYASAEVQQLAKDQGYAGLIVVAPQIPSALRSTRDNYSTSAAVPATWQLLDHLTATYNIDADRIYASGQSMGGMQVIAMAAQRDNYFAAVWPIASQWGSNNNLNVPFEGAAYYPSNDATIWSKDAHGNSVDYRNWYYMVSDDNILIDNCIGDSFSSSIWGEAAVLYKDITSSAIDIKGTRYTKFNPLTTALDDQNAAVRALVATTDFKNPDFGMIWEAYDGGSHQVTWVYAHRLFANYQWLLSRTRQSEMNRAKLALDKPFVPAAVQLTDATHLIFAGQTAYYKTAAAGSGTAGYNAAFENPQGALVRKPGWTAADYGY